MKITIKRIKTIRILFLLVLLMPLTGRAQSENHADTYFPKGSLNLRTNTVYWLLLTPNLGVEYKASDNIGLIVDGGWSHWNINSKNKYWRMWNVAPQARYYTGRLKNNYLGVQYTMGEYNLEGSQGKYMGGGLALGHQFSCSKNLMVDLGLSLGYLYLHDKENYTRIDGNDYRNAPKTANGYWGPTSLSVTFVWKLN